MNPTVKESAGTAETKRLGIFGGSFDPVHIGHLILAEQACDALHLDMVYFMPCADQPLKPGQASASGELRKDMLACAIEGNERFGILEVELQRGGTSYTVDSLEEISARFPGQRLYFLTGGDKLAELHRWKHLSRIGELCGFAVFPRPGSRLEVPDKLCENLHIQFAGDGRHFDISSSEIRRRVAEGKSIRYLVPRGVERIIYDRHIYGVCKQEV